MYTRSLAQCVLCSRLQRECVYQKSPPGEPASVERADGPGGAAGDGSVKEFNSSLSGAFGPNTA